MATGVHSLYPIASSSSQQAKPYPPHLVDNFNTQYPSTYPSSMSTTTIAIPSTGVISSFIPAPSSSACNDPPIISVYPRRPNVVKRIINRVKLEHYRYEVTLGVYSMTIGEKLVINGFVLLVISLTIWALFLYFPSLLYQKICRLDWLFTGRDTVSVGPHVMPPAKKGNWTALSLVKVSPLRSSLWDMALLLGLIFSLFTLLTP